MNALLMNFGDGEPTRVMKQIGNYLKSNMKQVEDNDLYQRLVTDDGRIEMGIYPVIFGYRVRAGYVDRMSYELDWCGGDKQEDLELLYSIMKNILEKNNSFTGVPMKSTIKPFYNDHLFVDFINSLVTKPLEIVKLKPLHLDRMKLMKIL